MVEVTSKRCSPALRYASRIIERLDEGDAPEDVLASYPSILCVDSEVRKNIEVNSLFGVGIQQFKRKASRAHMNRWKEITFIARDTWTWSRS